MKTIFSLRATSNNIASPKIKPCMTNQRKDLIQNVKATFFENIFTAVKPVI